MQWGINYVIVWYAKTFDIEFYTMMKSFDTNSKENTRFVVSYIVLEWRDNAFYVSTFLELIMTIPASCLAAWDLFRTVLELIIQT